MNLKPTIGKNLRFIFTEEQKDYMVDLYSELKSCVKVAEIFGVSKHCIGKVLKERNVKLVEISDRKFNNGVTINRNCFSDFSEEPAAYYYGLLLADGYLSSVKTVTISQFH